MYMADEDEGGEGSGGCLGGPEGEEEESSDEEYTPEVGRLTCT